jgi:hypothetical protein
MGRREEQLSVDGYRREGGRRQVVTHRCRSCVGVVAMRMVQTVW